MKLLVWLAHYLSAIGAINWGLVKFFKFNLVSWLAEITSVPNVAQILYVLVALSGIYALLSLFVQS